MSASYGAVYDPLTGRIAWTVAGPAEAVAAAQGPEPGYLVLEIGALLDNARYRVDVSDPELPALVERTPLPAFDKLAVAADGVDKITCSGLPNPTEVTVSGAGSSSATVTTGLLELTFDTPGTYRVRLDAGLAYQVREETVNAT